MRGRARRAWTRAVEWRHTPAVLLASALWLFVAVLSSHDVLPRLVSACGRLVQLPLGERSLSLNHAGLVLPEGSDWERIELGFDLHEGEAVSLVLAHTEHRMVVLRASRLDDLSSAILGFDDGTLVDRVPFVWRGAADATAARLVVERRAEVVTIRVDGGAAYEVALPADAHGFEATLFPPASLALHQRLHLGAVTLRGGAPLSARPWHAIATSAILQGLVIATLAWRRRDGLGRWLEGRFPVQASGQRASIVVFLITVNVLLLALAVLPKAALIRMFTTKMRWVYRVLVLMVVGWCLFFMTVRDRFMGRFPAAARTRVFRPTWLPAMLVIFTLTCVVVVVGAYAQISVQTDPDATPLAEGTTASMRVAVYGGSTTRGFPFPVETWRSSYPELTEAELHASGHTDARVWNMGMDAATMGEIADMLAQHLPVIRPTDVVINSVINNAFSSPEVMQESLTRALALLDGNVEDLILIEEPTLETVYGTGRWPRVLMYYPVLEAAAENGRARLLDPSPRLHEHRDEFLFMDDVHLTPHGHRVMAEVLAEALIACPAGSGRGADGTCD